MAVKAVEMVRKIRNKHFRETKGLSAEEQLRYIQKKSARLLRTLGDQSPTLPEKKIGSPPASKS